MAVVTAVPRHNDLAVLTAVRGVPERVHRDDTQHQPRDERDASGERGEGQGGPRRVVGSVAVCRPYLLS
ncbi:hypothetical protein [Glycomyces sp. NPDC021274]|uniref:hypothetical protein n=1 Tax=Glycomyces sp. NPDC021274 TaxID=3155120 RepID=UPI0033D982FA